MIFDEIDAFGQAIPQGQRLLGLDFGTKTIGLALSDTRWSIASPLVTLKRGKLKADQAALLEQITTHQIGGLVLGLPRNMDGSEGPRCQSTRAFAANILPAIERPILLWDERLSTAAVERTLLEADTSRAKRGKVIDKMAAGFILQGALDRLRQLI